MSNKALNETFGNVGKENGYGNVTADFASFKEFKVQWQRSYGWADFKVSDYLEDAPADVIEGLAETIFSRIGGKQNSPYSDAVCNWITSDDFVRTKRPTYIRRAKNLARTAKGTHKDLLESYERLISSGLIERDDDVFVSWTTMPNMKRVGYCSVLMKVVVISSVFDAENVPDYVVDFVLYHELLHQKRGFDPFRSAHDREFKEEERKHPMWQDAEDYLKKLCLYV